ncbi:Tail fiber protein [Escherichia coli]|uniref:Tail fiber protein n=1 Tax=Escherichia coli TaxID=562 RepID=A0A376U810_ECOLX|nr:Tail fiber protein [Escherichia coli]
MSQAVITKAFAEWKAQQAINNQPVTLDEFIFAYIPGLDADKPINNTETTPAEDKIVCRQAVNKAGVVNENSVVYSVTLGRMWAILISTGSGWQIRQRVHWR